MNASGAARKRRAVSKDATAFQLEAHIFYCLSQVLSLRTRALNIELRRFGLNYSRWRVLAMLQGHPGCSMLQLAELTSVDRTTLVHTVRLMQREGLISRHERVTDRRSVALTLTLSGRARFNGILPVVLAQTDRALAGFTPADVGDLHRKLAQVIENLRN